MGLLTYTPEYSDNWGIKVLNENMRNKIEDACKMFRERCIDDLNKIAGLESIKKDYLKEYFIRTLYPTREERLEQDVLIEERGHSSSDVIDDTPYDFYMTRVFSGIANKPKVIEKPTSKQYIGIRVLNRDMYDKVKTSLDKYETNVEPNERLTNYLKRHLYPTREERLEQDVKIHTIHKYTDERGILENDWKDYEYFISGWGDIGTITKEPKYNISWGVKILNEEMRPKIEQLLFSLKDKGLGKS
ncbi:MAG: hypothetical protein BWZ03_00499 [bacterium ADurb.BinA186]|nr:MAG: hypothetical protein BWZ03_00499 [bacterium ADurb.BinA186]